MSVLSSEMSWFVPTKGGYPLVHYGKEGHGFKSSNSGNALAYSTLLRVMGVLEMCVNWGNNVKAHKTVCLGGWG